MTGREWQPGDVALAKYEDEEPTIYLRSKGFATDRERHRWVSSIGTHSYDFSRAEWHRLLVVIDPESADVERLQDLFWQNQHHSGLAMQAALRELASPTPPKPDEPTNRWSVVVDGAGDQWVRVLGPDFIYGWSHAGGFPDNVGGWTAYQEIDAVKVLSSGVEPGEPS